jgi:capsular polysaccharide biosynthesis protein
VKLLVPKHTHTQLQKDIFALLHIPTDRIQLLEEDQLYKIRYLYTRKQYETPPSPFTQDHIWIFKECRKGLAIPDKPTTRRVYLQRDGRSNPATNNSEAGILRQIKNESELVKMLQDEFQFEVIQMGNKSVYEKAEALAGIDALITPLGANCMNLVFGQPPNKVLLLSNATPIGHDYYIPLASAVNSQAIPFDTFLYPVIEHSDPKNQWNGSFIVDVHQIREWIKRNLLQDKL